MHSEAYYLDQNLLQPEEWQTFLQSLRKPLPTTFRFTAGKSTTKHLIEHMRNHFLPELSDIDWEGEKLAPPQPLAWYPEDLAWQIEVKKAVLRKQEQFKNFQRFLVNETEVGSISRQEAVSMIPPLFLDVRPEHIVLDMCAAPGSKTAQLIEALHSPITSSPDKYDPCPPGLIVANDSDQKRAYMLVHQATRLPSPNLIVTNLDASALPKVLVPWKDEKDDSSVTVKELKYDRVLADVPCSGDGTLRKNVGIWSDWNLNSGVGLHTLQLRILLRGLNALRPGGRLVYSTCSLNPIENEAVVAAAVRECGADPAKGHAGSVRIVDVQDQNPELQRRPGVTTWKVAPGLGRHLFAGSASNMQPKQASKTFKAAGVEAAAPNNGQKAGDETEQEGAEATVGQGVNEEQLNAAEPTVLHPGSAEYRATLPAIPFVDSWNRLAELDKGLASRTAKTLWPQGDEAQLGIAKCMRIYPQLQNTGGFFIAVLDKIGNAKAESQSAGMFRALEALDSGAPPPEYAGNSTMHKKRDRSPWGDPSEALDDEESCSKKPRTEETTIEDEAAEAIEVRAEPSSNVKPDKHGRDRARKAEQQRKQRQTDAGFGVPGGTPYREDPFAFTSTDNDQVVSIAKFFGLSKKFPVNNLLVRNKDGLPLRTIYLASSSARAVLSGGGSGIMPHPSLNPQKLRVLNAGVKVFARQESNKAGDLECKWRLISDGLGPVRPFVSHDNVLAANLSDVANILSQYYPFFNSLPQGSFKSKVEAARVGSYIMEVHPSKHESFELKDIIYMPVWRAATSVNLMLDKVDRTAVSMRLFGEDLSVKARKQADDLTKRSSPTVEASAAAEAFTVIEAANVAPAKKEQVAAQVSEELGVQESKADGEVKEYVVVT